MIDLTLAQPKQESKGPIIYKQRCPVYTSLPGQPHENLQYSSIIRINATAPNGAYWRIMALILIFLAAFRYFSDSERREVDRWDIPNTVICRQRQDLGKMTE